LIARLDGHVSGSTRWECDAGPMCRPSGGVSVIGPARKALGVRRAECCGRHEVSSPSWPSAGSVVGSGVEVLETNMRRRSRWQGWASGCAAAASISPALRLQAVPVPGVSARARSSRRDSRWLGSEVGCSDQQFARGGTRSALNAIFGPEAASRGAARYRYLRLCAAFAQYKSFPFANVPNRRSDYCRTTAGNHDASSPTTCPLA